MATAPNRDAGDIGDSGEDEQQHTREAIRLMHAKASQIHQRLGGAARRAMFAKHHGCVRGVLTPEPGRSPETRHGIFADDTPHDVWLRLSNAAPEPRPDSEGSGRGLAIKVLDVEGPRQPPIAAADEAVAV